MFTPPLRPLTPKTSAGFAVIEFAAIILGIKLYPWQEWLLIHALELLPNGLFRFRTVVVLVARQNGKSTLGQVLALWFLYVRQVSLVLGTAQSLDLASDLWRDTVEMAEEVPELAAEIEKVTKQISRETLELTNRRRYKVAAASRRGGRGKTGDLILLDELREHQTWHAWSAITKTTMARAEALVWCMSNAGDATSAVLRHLRKQAHFRVGDPDEICDDPNGELPSVKLESDPDLDEELLELMEEQADSLGIFEWSAPPGCDIWDRDGWAAANPSMGYGGLTERNIASATSDPEWEFRTEVLCQWFDGALQGPFPQGSWERGQTTEQPPAGTELWLGLDVSADRSKTHIVAAYWRPDGAPQVSLEASRPGTEWVLGWLADHASEERPLYVGMQQRGAPASSILADVEKLKQALEDGTLDPILAVRLAGLEHVHVTPWGGMDLGNATADIYDQVAKASMGDDGVREGLCHLPAPALDVAAATAVPKVLTDGGMAWDRVRSPQDIAPLVAATVALWMLKRMVSEQRSAYDEGAALTVLD